jgi:O-antigen/teichoic acid export membrane protein
MTDLLPAAEGLPPVAGDKMGRARSRRLVSATLTALLSRGAGSVALLLMIPVTLGYLGDKVYGLWMAIASVTSMAAWADFGLGNGLLTKLAPCYARGDWDAGRRYVSTAYALLSITAGVMLAALWALSGVIPWAAIVNIKDSSLVDLARLTALVCLSALLINIPLSLVQRAQYAYQQVAKSNLWQAAGSLGAVVLAWTAVHMNLGPVAVVGCAVSGPLVANALASLTFYFGAHRKLRPRASSVDLSLAGSLLRLAGQFFVLSIVTAAALSADNLIIAHALNLEAVTQFSVPARVFTALGLMVTLVNAPLWPANGEALARGEYAWVRRTTNRMTWLSGGAVLMASALLVLAQDKVLRLFVGAHAAQVPALLGLALGAWWLAVATTSPRFMVQNAAGVVRPQLVGWTAFLLVSVPLKWLVTAHIGIIGIPLVGAAAYVTCVWPGAIAGYRRTLARASIGAPEMVVRD